MKIESGKTDSEVYSILQKASSKENVSALEESFTRLQVKEDAPKAKDKNETQGKCKVVRVTKSKEQKVDENEVEQLHDKLGKLNLKETRGELIERSPTTLKITKVPKTKPYENKFNENESQRVYQIASYKLSCGGTSTEASPPPNDLNIPQTYTEPDVLHCEQCQLQLANTKEFYNYVVESLQRCDASPVARPATVTRTVVRKIQARKTSSDSGLGSDVPSPLSDVEQSLRAPRYVHILPKPPEGTRKAGTAFAPNITERSATEALLAILDNDARQVQWIEYAVKKMDDEIFGVDDEGRTILHQLLCSKNKYIKEAFYAVVERMKKNPHKCQGIISAQQSICDEMQRFPQPILLKNYFLDALQKIQDKI